MKHNYQTFVEDLSDKVKKIPKRFWSEIGKHLDEGKQICKMTSNLDFMINYRADNEQ